jgi:hypothetical protein
VRYSLCVGIRSPPKPHSFGRDVPPKPPSVGRDVTTNFLEGNVSVIANMPGYIASEGQPLGLSSYIRYDLSTVLQR